MSHILHIQDKRLFNFLSSILNNAIFIDVEKHKPLHLNDGHHGQLVFSASL